MCLPRVGHLMTNRGDMNRSMGRGEEVGGGMGDGAGSDHGARRDICWGGRGGSGG